LPDIASPPAPTRRAVRQNSNQDKGDHQTYNNTHFASIFCLKISWGLGQSPNKKRGGKPAAFVGSRK
jgi:hypothetical protein